MFNGFANFIFKKIELWLLFLILLAGIFFSIGLANFAQKTAIKNNTNGTIGKIAYQISTLPETVKSAVLEGAGYTNRYAKVDDELWNKLEEYGQVEQLSGYTSRTSPSGDRYELLRLSDGSVYKTWENLPNRPRAVSLYDNTLLLGGVVGAEDSSRALKKYNQQGEELWSIPLFVHHTIFTARDGLIYTPIVMPTHEFVQSLMPEGSIYRDDGYAVIHPNGDILETNSVTQILLDNNLGHLILGIGPLEQDAIHLNSIKVADRESDHWEIGDLLMSARHLSLIFLYRPSTGEVVWHQSGPWLNQHDPDFISDTEISVFGNDMVSSFSNRTTEEADNYIDKGNKIYVYDFETNETTTRFDSIMESTGLATVTSGEHHIFEDGSLFVWFSNTGVSIVYDKKTDAITYLGAKHSDNWLDRLHAPRHHVTVPIP